MSPDPRDPTDAAHPHDDREAPKDEHPEDKDDKADDMIEQARERTGRGDDIAGGSPGQSPAPQEPEGPKGKSSRN